MLDLDAIRTRLANKPRYLDTADMDNIMRYNAWLLAAPSDIAALLAEVERLRAEVARLAPFEEVAITTLVPNPDELSKLDN